MAAYALEQCAITLKEQEKTGPRPCRVYQEVDATPARKHLFPARGGHSPCDVIPTVCISDIAAGVAADCDESSMQGCQLLRPHAWSFLAHWINCADSLHHLPELLLCVHAGASALQLVHNAYPTH